MRTLREVISEFNPDAFGTARWESVPVPAKPTWITDEFSQDAPHYVAPAGPSIKRTPADGLELEEDEPVKDRTYRENKTGAQDSLGDPVSDPDDDEDDDNFVSFKPRSPRKASRKLAYDEGGDYYDDDQGYRPVGLPQARKTPSELAEDATNTAFYSHLVDDHASAAALHDAAAKSTSGKQSSYHKAQALSHRFLVDRVSKQADMGPGTSDPSQYTPMDQMPSPADSVPQGSSPTGGTAADTSMPMPGDQMPMQQQNITPGQSIAPNPSINPDPTTMASLFATPPTSVVDKIAASVLASNPGLGLEKAVAVARQTVQRYPAVAKRK